MRALSLIAVVALVVSGCGSSESDSTDSPGASGTAGQGGTGGTGGGTGGTGGGTGGTGGGIGGTGGGQGGGTQDFDGDGYDISEDCDDTNPDIHPGAEEICNGIDDNCDGNIDEGVIETFYLDKDLDGYGVDDPDTNVQGCEPDFGYAKLAGDCDDNDSTVNPGADEVCNGIDDNCDGNIDEGVLPTLYIDKDGDGYGVDDSSTNLRSCNVIPGYSLVSGDCDDTNPAVNPGATEIIGNEVDEDCDGIAQPCQIGLIECDNNVKRQCEPSGLWGAAVDCGGGFCNTTYGCVVCNPGEAQCSGNTLQQCDWNGAQWIETYCDPLMGSSCEPMGCTGPCSKQSLGMSYIGCDYYPTVTVNTALGAGNFAVAVSNTSTQTATVTVTQGTNTVATRTVASGDVAVIILPWNGLKTATDTARFNSTSYRLRSTQPVTVYQFNPLEYNAGGSYTYTNDASLLLPVTVWRDDYIVVSRQSWPFGSLYYPGFYAVVASEQGTQITIQPSATSQIRAGAGLSGSGAGTLTLNAGDVLQVLSANSPSYDLTGTRIVSNKPIQVISGHDCTYVPSTVAACDHLEESMFPVITLANDYIVSATSLPGQTNPKAVLTRVVAVEPNTSLSYDPPNSAWPSAISTAGAYVELDSTAAFQISANHRIAVAQYMKGQDAGGGSGDPAMALAVATSQFRNSYLFHAPVNYSYSYLNVTAPTGTPVLLDGVVVTGFAAVGNTGFSVARVAVSNSGNGNHNITSADPFGITVYGYGSYTSYWYPGGLNLLDM